MRRGRISAWVWGGFGCALLLAPLTARAQMESREAIELQNEILSLRHDLETLQQKGTSGGSALGSAKHAAPSAGAAASGDLLTQLLDRVSTLEDQTRQLRGHVDELTNQVTQQNADLSKKIDDLNFRIDSLDGGKHPPAATGEAEAPPPSVSPPPAPLGTLPVPPEQPAAGAAKDTAKPAAKPTAEAFLEQGHAALARHDYPAAQDAAEQALAAKGGHAVDARFLLAQSLAAQRQFQKAALAFDDTYKAAPSGPHAPDSLLGLAESLTAINAKPAACATLAKFAKEFPAAKPSLRERASALRQRAACG
jgi:TolA-binding protein